MVRSWRKRRSFTWSRHGELADLVEEERPALGQLELALALDVGAGEGAALVPEELGLEEGLGDGAAVDGHEGSVAPRAPAWMARAISSLPVPLSPSMRTVASVLATRWITAKISRMRGGAADDLLEADGALRACAAASPSRASSAR